MPLPLESRNAMCRNGGRHPGSMCRNSTGAGSFADNPVLSTVFCLVEPLVRQAIGIPWRFEAADGRVCRADAHRDGSRRVLPMDGAGGYVFLHSVQKADEVVKGKLVADEDELVAAHADKEGLLQGMPLQTVVDRPAEIFEGFVAEFMPVDIVAPFEVVDVEECQGEADARFCLFQEL